VSGDESRVFNLRVALPLAEEARPLRAESFDSLTYRVSSSKRSWTGREPPGAITISNLTDDRFSFALTARLTAEGGDATGSVDVTGSGEIELP